MSSSMSTKFGMSDRLDLISVERPRQQRRRRRRNQGPSIENVLKSMSTALRLDDELETYISEVHVQEIEHEQHVEQHRFQVPSSHSSHSPNNAAASPTRRILAATLREARTIARPAAEQEESFRHDPIHVPSAHRPRRRRTDDSSDSITSLAEHFEMKSRTSSKQSKNIKPNYHDRRESLHMAIMNDIKQDIKETRRLHCLYNLNNNKDEYRFGTAPRNFDSGHFDIEIDGIVVPDAKARSALRRERSVLAKTA